MNSPRLARFAVFCLSAALLSASCAVLSPLKVSDPSFTRAKKVVLASVYTVESIGGLNAGLLASVQGFNNTWGKDLLPSLTAELRARLTSELGFEFVDDAKVVAHPNYAELTFIDPLAGTVKGTVAVPPLKPMSLIDPKSAELVGGIAEAVGADVGLTFSIHWNAERDLNNDYKVQTSISMRAVDTTGRLVWDHVEIVSTTQSFKLSELGNFGADMGAAITGAMREEPTKRTAMSGARDGLSSIIQAVQERR